MNGQSLKNLTHWIRQCLVVHIINDIAVEMVCLLVHGADADDDLRIFISTFRHICQLRSRVTPFI